MLGDIIDICNTLKHNAFYRGGEGGVACQDEFYRDPIHTRCKEEKDQKDQKIETNEKMDSHCPGPL